MTASIFVVGPEGSGTTLVWRCIAAHPELHRMTVREAPERRRAFPAAGLLLHLSLPTLRPKRWVDPDELPRGAKVVVIRRSAVHTVYSAYRRFYRDPATAWRAYFRAVELEARYIAACNPACVSYEDLVCNPAKVLRSIYEWLGVQADFLPRIRLHSRNDERWRTDKIFGDFMRKAFGSLPGNAVVAADGKRARVARRRLDSGPEGKRIARTRYVRIPDVLARGDHARLVEHARIGTAGAVLGGRRSAAGRGRRRAAAHDAQPDRIWCTLEERLRRFLPYVRQQLLLPWAPIRELEWQVTMERTPAGVLDRAGHGTSGTRGRITCIYTVVADRAGAGGGQLRLIAGGRGRSSGERCVRIKSADNAAVFFVGGLQSQAQPRRRRPSSESATSPVSIAVSFELEKVPQWLTPGDRSSAAR